MNLARPVAWLGVALVTQASVAAPPRVLVTLPALYSWTANVAGTNATVEALMPAESGPHQYQLRPQDLQRFRRANLLIINGLGVDEWIAKAALKELHSPGSFRVVCLSTGLDSLLIRSDRSADPNPHIWLDPQLAGLCVSNLVQTLSQFDPAAAAAYAANGAAYQRTLANLDQEIRDGISGLACTNLVTFHDAFPYFAHRYGLNLLGVIEDQPNVDPSPRHLGEVSRMIRGAHVPVIFTEPQYSSRLVDRIAADLHVKVATLDVLETGVPATTFYVDSMRRNLRVLQENLR